MGIEEYKEICKIAVEAVCGSSNRLLPVLDEAF